MTEKFSPVLLEVVNEGLELYKKGFSPFDTYKGIRHKIFQVFEKDLGSKKSTVIADYEKDFNIIKDAKFIHASYLDNLLLSLKLKRHELLTKEKVNLDIVDQYLRPKKGEQQNSFIAIVKAILIKRLHDYGSSYNSAFRLATDMLGGSQRDAAEHYYQLSKLNMWKWVMEELSLIDAMIIMVIDKANKPWRIAKEDLEKENRNAKKAIQGAYTAYEKFVSTTGKYFFPKVSEHIKKYDDPIIKLIITSEELPKYKSDTLSFN